MRFKGKFGKGHAAVVSCLGIAMLEADYAASAGKQGTKGEQPKASLHKIL